MCFVELKKLSFTFVNDFFHGLYVYFFRINFTAVVVDLNIFICMFESWHSKTVLKLKLWFF